MKVTIKKLNEGKRPIVRIDKKLNGLAEKDLFPEKLEQANRTLSTAGLPKKPKKLSPSNRQKNQRVSRLARS